MACTIHKVGQAKLVILIKVAGSYDAYDDEATMESNPMTCLVANFGYLFYNVLKRSKLSYVYYIILFFSIFLCTQSDEIHEDI
jgi:hypothetical protein